MRRRHANLTSDPAAEHLADRTASDDEAIASTEEWDDPERL